MQPARCAQAAVELPGLDAEPAEVAAAGAAAAGAADRVWSSLLERLAGGRAAKSEGQGDLKGFGEALLQDLLAAQVRRGAAALSVYTSHDRTVFRNVWQSVAWY